MTTAQKSKPSQTYHITSTTDLPIPGEMYDCKIIDAKINVHGSLEAYYYAGYGWCMTSYQVAQLLDTTPARISYQKGRKTTKTKGQNRIYKQNQHYIFVDKHDRGTVVEDDVSDGSGYVLLWTLDVGVLAMCDTFTVAPTTKNDDHIYDSADVTHKILSDILQGSLYIIHTVAESVDAKYPEKVRWFLRSKAHTTEQTKPQKPRKIIPMPIKKSAPKQEAPAESYHSETSKIAKTATETKTPKPKKTVATTPPKIGPGEESATELSNMHVQIISTTTESGIAVEFPIYLPKGVSIAGDIVVSVTGKTEIK